MVKYLGFDTLDNYINTHYVERFPNRESEAIILIPKNNGRTILLGVNRNPYLLFIGAVSTINMYELFETDCIFNYSILDGKIVWDDSNDVRISVSAFSSMIMGVMKSAGSENRCLSEIDNNNLIRAVRNKNEVERRSRLELPREEIISILQMSDSSYAININGKDVFRSRNYESCDVVFELFKKVVRLFVNRIQTIK